jgi:predicted MFS family arabinose efflux permease
MSSTAETAETTAPIPRFTIVLLSLAALGSGASLRTTDALLPQLAQEFSISLGEASTVITVFSVAYGFAQLLFGPLGDRFGKYLVIAWAVTASSITAAFCALVPDFSGLLAARLLAGATAAALIPLSMAWIGDVVPYNERQPVLARFLIGQIVGVSVGIFLGGWAADYGNWRLPFAVIAVWFALLSFALFALNRRLPDYARRTTVGEGAVWKRLPREFGYVLSQPWARVVLTTVFLEGTFLFGAFAFIASHLHHVHGMALTSAGGVVMLFGLGGCIFAGNSARFIRRLGETGLAAAGGTLAAISVLIVAIAPLAWALPACLLAGTGFYMLHNTLQTHATQMAPQRRGAAVSAFASCFFLGQSAGVGLAGLWVEKLGTSWIIALGAAGVWIVALGFRHLLVHRRRAS